MGKTKIIAHRGASGYAPENTIIAFKKAIEMGVDGLELDVQLSKDGVAVICHDEKVDRTTNGTGFIKDLTLKEIEELDAGSWFDERFCGEKIPTLEELMYLIRDENILLNIEIKNNIIQYEGIVEKIIKIIEGYNKEKDTIISSFNHNSLLKVKKINNNLKTGALYMSGLVEPWNYAKRINVDALHPFFYNIKKELVKKCLDNEILVNPFTVDTHKDIRKMIDAKVTGIITNYPDRAKSIIKGVCDYD
ncbi:glycerophosphodiester phosphodiesterase [Dethiothermospora halolimnae]|uniref:glycerophosphodiester phosphodiesterase n=1 Tax=Dethiothermospora halolimnae TaxID=3114390 RepID=UPI003CCBDBE9